MRTEFIKNLRTWAIEISVSNWVFNYI